MLVLITLFLQKNHQKTSVYYESKLPPSSPNLIIHIRNESLVSVSGIYQNKSLVDKEITASPFFSLGDMITKIRCIIYCKILLYTVLMLSENLLQLYPVGVALKVYYS